MADQDEARTPKACRTCAKAKVRCEPETDGMCKRCRRLRKECSSQAPGAHRRPKPTTSPEVSALEAKLDRMVALLAASERSARGLPSGSSPGQFSAAYSSDNITLGELEGEVFLEIFRKMMVPLFPFIMIPANVTAEQLRREKPFLFLNIAMVACQDGPRQREILNLVRKSVSERLVLRGEHSLDLLQGLLVHLAWFISISRRPWNNGPGQSTEAVNADLAQSIHVQGSAQLDVFLQLAVSQVISLSLNQGMISARNLDRPLAYMRAVDLHPDQIPPRTLEERRTYLGSYYLTVMLSACVRDMEPLRFTKYSQECCQVLEQASEFPTDGYLVQLVRVAHLADQIVHTVSLGALDSPATLSPLLGISIRSHQAQLQQLRASFTGDSPYSTVLSFHYDTLEIILYRIALRDDLADCPFADAPVTRVDLLFRCLEATKSFFYNFYSMDHTYFPFFPFSLWCQFGQAVVNMSRLLLYQNDSVGWDQSYVQTAMDFHGTIDGLQQKLDEARCLSNRGDGDQQHTGELPEVFERLHARMRLMKELHSKREEIQKQARPQAPQPPDLSFMFNVPFDAFFPYGDFGGLPSAFEAPMSL